MRISTFACLAFALWLGTLAGCGRGGGVDAGMDARVTVDTGPRLDTPISIDVPRPPVDTGVDSGGRDTPAPRDTGGVLCSSIICTGDAQCAAMCPTNPRGANCCDTAVGRCFASTMPMCPPPPMDGGMMMSGT